MNGEFNDSDLRQRKMNPGSKEERGNVEADHKTNKPKAAIPDAEQRLPSLFSYLSNGLRQDNVLDFNEQKLKERRKRIYTFMKTPRELEKFLLFGTLLCLDVFLFLFTYLPIRVGMAIVSLLYQMCSGNSKLYWLNPGQKIDLLKAFILVFCCLAMTYVDTSILYHSVRGQTVVKLYVIYNMLDVVDKLFASFGQDVLDALYWTATEPRDRKREHIGTLPHLLLSLIYVFIHTLLNLGQAIVLNVALNSFNKALLTILISNQFVEIKGSVFKRFETNNLFQMSCSDARERFHHMILLIVVSLRNLAAFNWNIDKLLGLLPDFALVYCSEYVVDWFKHAFITKFNNIKPDVYVTYRSFLAKNVLNSNQNMTFTGHVDNISRRMGFTALPYACLSVFPVFQDTMNLRFFLMLLIVRAVTQSVPLSGWSGAAFGFSLYLTLCAVKILLSLHIFGKAARYADEKSSDADTVDSSASVDEVFTSSGIQEICSLSDEDQFTKTDELSSSMKQRK